MFPPSAASGEICPTTNPCVPPEKRPSVINPTLSPKPNPIIADVGFNISLIPGPPLGPSYLITITSPSLIEFDNIASTPSSSELKTRALPSKEVPSLPVILATAPSTAKFPYIILR